MNRTVRQLLETQLSLRNRPRFTRDGVQKVPSSFVFPSPRTDEQLVEIKYSFARAVKEAKITDLRFHDLRHYSEFRTITG
jgi:integrase